MEDHIPKQVEKNQLPNHRAVEQKLNTLNDVEPEDRVTVVMVIGEEADGEILDKTAETMMMINEAVEGIMDIATGSVDTMELENAAEH